MAKSKQWTPKRVRNEEDRNTGSAGFIDLTDGQNFLGYALFDGDPAKDEPGYYEYLQHWVTGAKGGRSVPCAGDDCPFCEDGDKPRDVAYTAWLVLKDADGNELNDGEGQVLAFRMNSILIKQVTEMRGEDESPKGTLFRVSRLDDRGNYVMSAKPKKPLSAAKVKEVLKESDIDFDAMVTNRLKKAMEGVALARAVDADDDDDGEDKKAAKGGKKGGKKKEEPEEPETEEWPAKAKELEVTVSSVDDDGNFINVTHDDYDGEALIYTSEKIEFDLTDLEEDQVVTVSYKSDDDGDFILSAEPEPAEAEDPDEDEKKKEDEDNDLPDEIDDEQFEVVSVDGENSTMEVKSDDLDLEFTLYFLDRGKASKVDFDDYEEGTIIKLSAEKDTTGDMVATQVPEVVEDEKPAKKTAKGGKGGKADKKTSGGKKGGKKGGKGK